MIVCKLCGSKNTKLIFKHNKIPKYNLNYQKEKKKSLTSQLVKINFVICRKCEFVFNSKYNDLTYKVEYDAKRSYSKYFQNYLKSIAKELYLKSKNAKNIVEVGAGDGKFAEEFIKNYKKKINYSAFDVSWLVKQKKTIVHNVNKFNKLKKVPKYYNKKFSLKPDLLVLRHVLEHQSNVKNFIKGLIFEEPKFFFIEIPCWEFVKKNNFHYFSNEHCSYFSKKNLEYFMSKFGYKKVFLKYVFNKEYIISLWEKKKITKKLNLKFKSNINFDYNKWKNSIKKKLINSIMWGAGGKGVMLLNLLDIKSKDMEFIIDSNPHLENKFIPGTDIKIFGITKGIKRHRSNRIAVINPLYLNEIKNTVKKFSINKKIFSVFPKL